jgi:hypothetical protein
MLPGIAPHRLPFGQNLRLRLFRTSLVVGWLTYIRVNRAPTPMLPLHGIGNSINERGTQKRLRQQRMIPRAFDRPSRCGPAVRGDEYGRRARPAQRSIEVRPRHPRELNVDDEATRGRRTSGSAGLLRAAKRSCVESGEPEQAFDGTTHTRVVLDNHDQLRFRVHIERAGIRAIFTSLSIMHGATIGTWGNAISPSGNLGQKAFLSSMQPLHYALRVRHAIELRIGAPRHFDVFATPQSRAGRTR